MGDLIDVDINVEVDKLDLDLVTDEKMTAIHNLLAKMCEPFVPMDTGMLSQNVTVTPEYLIYNSPYAHYQYKGEVYGPNIPIMEKGVPEPVGWFSPPGQPKQPTGRPINYSKEMHPNASAEWDKAMMAVEGDLFIKQVEEIIKGGKSSE